MNMSFLQVLESRIVCSPIAADAYPELDFTLPSQEIAQTGITRASLIDRIDSVVRASAKWQNSNGAIIDPYASREVQYSTPYFAYAAATLISSGKSIDLLTKATLAMDWATRCYSLGKASIPDQHGEFYLFPLAEAYRMLSPLVESSKAATWLTRLKTPLSKVLTGNDWNWRTYAMKGAWALYGIGAMSRVDTVNFIESSWTGSQKARLTGNSWNLYVDKTSYPDTLPYDYASRGNLSYLLTAGYDGASAGEIKLVLSKGNYAGLFMVDPTGQAPENGRSGNHVWNDLVAAVTFERMARCELASGNKVQAGVYRRAANLAVVSADRWHRSDGSYYVTKNRHDPSQRLGYAGYSYLSNYNGYVMLHLSELYQEHRKEIAEIATPAEIGGYAVQTPSQFASVFASAGGLQVSAALSGCTSLCYEQYWSEIGVGRISKSGWDSRLGAISTRESSTGAAVSLSPMLYENGKWKRVAELPTRYAAQFASQIVSPQLVKCTITYLPRAGQTGPTFTQYLTITPDAILTTFTSTSASFRVTLPLLIDDGKPLTTQIDSSIATTRFEGSSDSLSYIALDAGGAISDPGTRITGATGTYAPLALRNKSGGSISLMVYPAGKNDPSASAVKDSYFSRKGNFKTVLGTVSAGIYVGRYSAGGIGKSADFNSDGVADLVFSDTVTWSARRKLNRIVAVVSDLKTTISCARKSYELSPYTVRYLG